MPKKNLFVRGNPEPYRLSRTGLEEFIECPRCFYLGHRLGIKRPPGFPFTVNMAFDTVMKNEFDAYRQNGLPHPLATAHGIDSRPWVHVDLDVWRNNRKGIAFHHPGTNLHLTGAIDDVWITPTGALQIVDYKVTSTRDPITIEDSKREGNKRQLDIYHWLFRQNGFTMAPEAFLVFGNVRKDEARLDGRLVVDLTILRYTTNDGWVDGKLAEAKACLESDPLPPPAIDCKYCAYRQEAKAVGG